MKNTIKIIQAVAVGTAALSIFALFTAPQKKELYPKEVTKEFTLQYKPVTYIGSFRYLPEPPAAGKDTRPFLSRSVGNF